MAPYLLNCTYCGAQWKVDYITAKHAVCPKCQDIDVTAKDLAKDSIDYYAGSPPFKDKEKPKELILEEPKEVEEDKSNDDNDYPFPFNFD